MKPAKITAYVLLALLMVVYVLLSGCADTWNAKVATDEIDFKQPVNVIPRVEIGFGGTF